jgi:hypothetical protein
VTRAGADGRQEAARPVRVRRDRAVDDVRGRHTLLLVEARVAAGIDRQRRTVERDACEQAAGARVRVHLSGEARIRRHGGLTAHRARRHRRIGAERQLAVRDAFDAGASGEHQHDVGGLHPRLPAKVETTQTDENRICEASVLVAHHQHAFAVASSEKECSLGDVRQHGDAVRALQEPVWNELVSGGADLLQHLRRLEQATLFTRLRVSLSGTQCESGSREESK